MTNTPNNNKFWTPAELEKRNDIEVARARANFQPDIQARYDAFDAKRKQELKTLKQLVVRH